MESNAVSETVLVQKKRILRLFEYECKYYIQNREQVSIQAALAKKSYNELL